MGAWFLHPPNEMQFAFAPGRGTTDVIFIVCQLHEKYITPLTNGSSLPSSTLRKPSIVCQESSWCGPRGAWVWMNVLCMSSRACITMPAALGESMVNTVRNLAWELECTRTLSLVHCSSCWYCKRCRVSSALVCHGSFSMLMTCCSSRTPRSSIPPSSRHGRLAWKVKHSVSTRRRPSSWSPVLTLLS